MAHLENKLQRELCLARRISLRGDHAERTGGDGCIRSAKDGRVERIERLGAKFQREVFGDGEVLEQR
jgi:hypothetical protein